MNQNDLGDDLRIALDRVPAMIWYKDLKGNFLRVNEALARAMGMPRAEIEGRNHHDLFPNDDVELYSRSDREVIKSGKPRRGLLMPQRLPNGERRWLLVDKIPYKDTQGRIIGVVAFALDITEHRVATEAASRLAAIVESSEDAIVSIDRNGTITSWNDGARRLYGYTHKEVKDRGPFFLAPPDRRDTLLRQFWKAFSGVPTLRHETQRLTKAGRLIDVSLTISPIRDGGGKIIGASVIGRDITERKRLEDASRESEARYRTLAESAQDDIFVYSKDGILSYVNAHAAARLGLRQEDLVGKRPADFFPPELVERQERMTAQVLATEESISLEEEIPLKRGLTWVSTKLVPILGEDGRPTAVMGISRDISRLKSAENRLIEQAQQLEEKNVALQQVLRQIEFERNAIKADVAASVKELVLPILDRLRLGGVPRIHLDLLEKNLRSLAEPFGRKMTDPRLKLTPRETEICDKIRNGLSSKEIAKLLGTSSQTIERHRKNIRKKLKISEMDINLTTFLRSA